MLTWCSYGTVDCARLPSGKSLTASAAFDQKEVQVSFSEASFSIMKTSGMTTEKGTASETGEQFTCKKVDHSLSMENAFNVEGKSGDQTLHRVTLEVGEDMHTSSVISDSTVRETDGTEAQVISKRGSSEAAGNL